ncbi:hypothetical protein BD779DRAFT_1801058 [Infundibulicybe gibba]|nr:hypothetical protein BD779DRAFT_1801058 [Infundibulicybe gibba]
MPDLLSLANELIIKISNELDTRKAFRTTCRRIDLLISPQLLSHIVIDINRARIGQSINQLEALAARSTRAVDCVHTVDIRNLAPDYYPIECAIYENGQSVVSNNPPNTRVDWAHEKMRELLPTALSTLTRARTVIGHIDSYPVPFRNVPWTRAVISDFLASLPALHTLHLTFSGIIKFDLSRISNLTKLVVHGYPTTSIAEIIGNNPGLTHLELESPNYSEIEDNTPTLHELLGKVPHSHPLQLQHLRTSGYCIRLDHETLPHLRLLKSLEVDFVVHIPDNEREYYGGKLIEKSDRYASSPGKIWKAVGREGLAIEAVETIVDDNVLDYLTSTSGIKKLVLSEVDGIALSHRFFDYVLPRHCSTLVSLSISATFEGPWCFGSHNIGILLTCTRLVELSIAVSSAELDKNKASFLDDIVGEIINMTAQLPDFYQLTLLCARQCHQSSGGASTMRYKNIAQELHNSITSFSPINPTIHPQLIITKQGKFRPQRCSDGGLKYVLCRRLLSGVPTCF